MKKNQNKKKKRRVRRKSICSWAVNGEFVRLYPGGRLVCSRHGAVNWCPHIETVRYTNDPISEAYYLQVTAPVGVIANALIEANLFSGGEETVAAVKTAASRLVNKLPERKTTLPELTGRRALTIEEEA